MAGVQFDIACENQYQSLISGILEMLKQRCTKRSLDLSFDHEDDRYAVSLDGDLESMQSFSRYLVISEIIDVFALAFPEPADYSIRKQVADQVAQKITESVGHITGMVFDVSEELGGFPQSYFFDIESDSELDFPLTSFTGVLILYHNGFIHNTPVIEAGHTALEVLLANLTGDKVPQGTSERFRKMVNCSIERKYLSEGFKEPLGEFNSMRANVKHDGTEAEEEDFLRLIPQVIDACHRLVRALPE